MAKHYISRFLPAALIAITVAGLLLLFAPQPARAFTEEKACFDSLRQNASFSDSEAKGQNIWTRYIKVSIPIPGLTQQLYCYNSVGDNTVDLESLTSIYYVEDLGSYLAGMYRFFVSIVGILAAVMIMYGGIRWILAAGNASRIQGAKDVIFSAIIGIVIAFCSYLLLFLLNPRLIDYNYLSQNLKNIAPIAQSTSFCKDVENLGKYKLNLVQTGTERCDGSTCSTDDRRLCGDRYALLSTEDTSATSAPTCYGETCLDPQSTCHQLGPITFACRKTYLSGEIAWDGNAYVDSMTLLAVCKNGELNTDLRSLGRTLDLSETDHAYSFPHAPYKDPTPEQVNYAFEADANALLNLARGCSGVSTGGTMNYTPQDLNNFGGFYLLIEINDDTDLPFIPTVDDTFVVGDSCLPLTLKTPSEITKDDWEKFALSNKLIPFESIFSNDGSTWKITKSKVCNLNITRNTFVAR